MSDEGINNIITIVRYEEGIYIIIIIIILLIPAPEWESEARPLNLQASGIER